MDKSLMPDCKTAVREMISHAFVVIFQVAGFSSGTSKTAAGAILKEIKESTISGIQTKIRTFKADSSVQTKAKLLWSITSQIYSDIGIPGFEKAILAAITPSDWSSVLAQVGFLLASDGAALVPKLVLSEPYIKEFVTNVVKVNSQCP